MDKSSPVDSEEDYHLAETYKDLRNQVFAIRPDTMGLKPTSNEVWGVIMETGYPGAIVSLVALADGTVSIYFSNDAGIIGLGQHPGPQKAAKAFISSAQQFQNKFYPTETFPVPKQEHSRFYVFIGNGVLTAEGKENEFSKGRHQLSPLFHKGQELISEIRAVDERFRAKQVSPRSGAKGK